MKLPIYYVDAFTDQLFSGNPAAVVFSQINDSDLMQKIAAENNLSETAFIREDKDGYHIRWFAPLCEIDLCGHATLASAFIFFKYIQPQKDEFTVQSLKNGVLKVTRKDDLLILDFPKDNLRKYDDVSFVEKIIGTKVNDLYKGRNDILAIVESEDEVKDLNIDLQLLNNSDVRGLIVSAPGTHYDFVSRFFTPQATILEDPVTGSAHCTLTPFWANRLSKKELKAFQISDRGGQLLCKDLENRVIIGGQAKIYSSGIFHI